MGTNGEDAYVIVLTGVIMPSPSNGMILLPTSEHEKAPRKRERKKKKSSGKWSGSMKTCNYNQKSSFTI